MFELLINGVGGGVIAYTVARVATGFFFVASGFHKIFNATRHQTLVDTLKACNIPCVPFFAWFVPVVELLAGLGVMFGFLTPLSALGLLIICLVALATDGIPKIKDWAPLDWADWIDDILYLPETLYVILLGLIITMGSGPVSLDVIMKGLST
jgi:uncharacterized membrane protein YphA (DoxX/SURF4 family)